MTPAAPVVAADFAGDTTNYRFGLNRDRAIDRLRDLANRLESGDYLLQAVEFSQTAKLENFTMSTLAISYAEKKSVPPQENNLADPLSGPRRIQVEDDAAPF